MSLSNSFGLSNILGLVFLLVGIVFFLQLVNFSLPIDIPAAPIQFAAALGSILGGLAMLFKKSTTVQQPKVKS